MTEENKNLITRPPVIVVMGHIDHGKSLLLDYIRKTNVVEKEAGGITQHIGAYEAEVKGKKITFLDTPGHETFSQMRLRGAHVADIGILVIAADEGVKPQTLESYEALKKSEIPFVVAINKIDKNNADPERVKKQLSEKNIFVEGYGGKIPVVNISAKTGEGIDELLDILFLLAEMENLKGDKNKNAEGVIIETKLDHQKGNSATCLILDGTLKKGMFVTCGECISPVRIFENFQGKPIEEASFSSPVKIVGFNKIPKVGEIFKSFNTKEEAEKEIEKYKEKIKIEDMSYIERTEENSNDENKIILPIILKADVFGSLEAADKEISKLKKDNLKIKILREAIGNINEDDAKLASSAQNSIILGFNVKIDAAAKDWIKRFNIEIFCADIVYKISEWLEEKIKERENILSNKQKEILGAAKILKTFSRTKTKELVGGKVISGVITESKKFEIKRNEEKIGEGKILQIQKNKTPVKEIKEGDEFGMMVETKIEILEGDEIIIV